MFKTNRLSGSTEWIFSCIWRIYHFRTPDNILRSWGSKRSCTAIHNRVQKADLQPAIGSTPSHVALDETVIRVDDAQRLETALARLGLRCQMCRHGNRNSERHAPLTARVYDAGDSVERVFREVRRRTSSFSNTFSPPIRQLPNRDCRPPPSGGIDAKVDTTPCRCTA